eukprot:3208252-Rhodomonas_salina.1
MLAGDCDRRACGTRRGFLRWRKEDLCTGKALACTPRKSDGSAPAQRACPDGTDVKAEIAMCSRPEALLSNCSDVRPRILIPLMSSKRGTLQFLLLILVPLRQTD